MQNRRAEPNLLHKVAEHLQDRRYSLQSVTSESSYLKLALRLEAHGVLSSSLSMSHNASVTIYVRNGGGRILEVCDVLLLETTTPRTSSRVHPTASAIFCCVWQAGHILKIRLLRATLPDPFAGPNSERIFVELRDSTVGSLPDSVVTAADRKAISEYLTAFTRYNFDGLDNLKSFSVLKQIT